MMISIVTKLFSCLKIGSGDKSNQSGSILVLVAIFLLPALAIVALVIDHSRQEIALQQLQDCGDAASLAASSKLDGTVYGWKNAKRSAMAVIKNCQVLGSEINDEFRASNDINLNEGQPDPLEASDYFNGHYYTHNQGDYGNLVINIDRGVYWQGKEKDDNDNPKMEFFSLEAAPQGSLTVEAGVRNKDGYLSLTNFIPPGAKAPEYMSMPTYTLANSVQVNVSLKHLDTTLGNIFGMLGFGKISKKATSINDTALEECVAPIAIPACSLMLDTDRNFISTNNYLTDAYQPEAQCERELVVAEAQTEVPAREDGIARSDSFPRPPYYKFKLPSEPPRLNNKAVGLKGTLGVPDLDGTGGSATASELSAHLSSLKNTGADCFKAKVGMKFKPLDTFFDKNETNHLRPLPAQEGFLNNPALEKELADLINDPSGAQKNPTFGEVFFDSAGNPLPNFPFLRNYRADTPQDPDVELRITWPLDQDGGTGEMLMSSMGEGNWTNPMCHSSLVEANDKTRAKVKEITAMIVVPSGEANYCDYPAVFAGSYQRSLPPTADTSPIVVGFKKVYLYDFNIMDLEDPRNHKGTTITPYYPSSGSPDKDVIDRNPISTRGYKGLASNPLLQMDMGELIEMYLQDIEGLNQESRECIYQCSTPPDDWEGQGFPGLWDCINDCPLSNIQIDFEDWLRNFVLDGTTREITDCVDECLAANPDTEISACDCYGEIEETSSPWLNNCFRPIDHFEGIRENYSTPTTDPGFVHPFLASKVIDPTNPKENNEYWKERFFDDPERYYPELVLLAMIIPNTTSEQTISSVEDGLTVSIPSYEELIADDGQRLDQFLSDITGRLKDNSNAETVTYKKFQNIFQMGWWHILGRPKPERYLGTSADKFYNLFFPTSFPNNIFWHAEWNSEILAVLAKIYGKDISAITDPANVFPVIKGTNVANPEATPVENYNAIAEVLQALNISYRDWKGNTEISLPGRHCLPKKRNNRFPVSDATSWQQPKDRDAQYGCGGLRMRLSCDSEQTLLGTKPPMELNPALVQ
jgi:hypothetical protein